MTQRRIKSSSDLKDKSDIENGDDDDDDGRELNHESKVSLISSMEIDIKKIADDDKFDNDEGDDEEEFMLGKERVSRKRRRNKKKDCQLERGSIVTLLIGGVIGLLALFLELDASRDHPFMQSFQRNHNDDKNKHPHSSNSKHKKNTSAGKWMVHAPPTKFPWNLVEPSSSKFHTYQPKDFKNEDGNVPPFWGPIAQLVQSLPQYSTTTTNENSSPPAAAATLTPASKSEAVPGWGPCYPPTQKSIPWDDLVQLHNSTTEQEKTTKIDYAVYHHGDPVSESIIGKCRPGFIIIGAGKCGTSSLYHYLADGHPRVLPAMEKQIHYFRYHANNPMGWYLTHFPTTLAFLSKGALLTGEASPGYMPYPDVAKLTADRLPGPKIIAIVREPISRAWSSYRYNYVHSALVKIRTSASLRRTIPQNKPDSFYIEHYLMTFEQMVRSELDALALCLDPIHGKAYTEPAKKYGSSWAKMEYERRNASGLPPLLDIDGHCYGNKVNSTVPRKQWATIIRDYPNKVVNVPNLHLVQSIVGRGVYTPQLEWWTTAFPTEDVYMVCSEHLRDSPKQTMIDLSSWLGLPQDGDSDYFDHVISQGMYNVGGHRGYDLVTSWNQSGEAAHALDLDEIPLSKELRLELEQFYKPWNERLFQLMSKRCDW